MICSRGVFEPAKLSKKLAEITKESEAEDLWQDPKKAGIILKEKNLIENKLNNFLHLDNELNDSKELIEIIELENDESSLNELHDNLDKLAQKVENCKIEALFSNEEDHANCFLEIHPGAGGTESHDWALMLARMYLRYAEKFSFKAEIMDEQKGDEAGLKSFTVKISGLNAYGWLKVESGVHRLVRISPFNAQGKRMTSFASVWVYPEVDDNFSVDIQDKDIRIDTYRASGAGGQHINKTDSAIRITHIPTNIVVQCQNSRSQHKNKEEAFKMLKSRLYELELRRKQEEQDKQNAKKTDNSWGNQIRSYVMQPYQMIKDLRTNHETANISAVLDGELQNFLSAALAMNL